MLDLRVDNFYSFLFLRRVIIINSNNISNTYLIYKFYNINNELLYIGITNDIKIRLKQHKQNKKWFKNVDKIYISNNTMSRNEAQIYEIYYIANSNPKYNINHMNGGKVDFMLDELIFEEYINKDMRFYRKKLALNNIKNMFLEGKNIDYIANKIEYSKEHTRRLLIELNLVEKQEKDKNMTPEVYNYVVEIINEFIYKNDYANMKDIKELVVNKFGHNQSHKKIKLFKLENILSENKFKAIRCNKQIKEKYNIKSDGYPFIIVKND